MTRINDKMLGTIHEAAAELRARYYEIPTPDRVDYKTYIQERMSQVLPEVAALAESEPALHNYCYSLVHGTYQLAARIAREQRLGQRLEEHAMIQELEDLLRVGNAEGAEVFLRSHEMLQDHVQPVCDQLIESLGKRRQTYFLAQEGEHIPLIQVVTRFRNRFAT